MRTRHLVWSCCKIEVTQGSGCLLKRLWCDAQSSLKNGSDNIPAQKTLDIPISQGLWCNPNFWHSQLTNSHQLTAVLTRTRDLEVFLFL